MSVSKLPSAKATASVATIVGLGVLTVLLGASDFAITVVIAAFFWQLGSIITVASVNNLPTDFVDFDVKKKKDVDPETTVKQ